MIEVSISISNWGPDRCWIGTPEGHCGEPPTADGYTCTRHKHWSRRAARWSRERPYLCSTAEEIAEIEASMQAAHGAIAEFDRPCAEFECKHCPALSQAVCSVCPLAGLS